jgi:dipeptidyl aminopeptidase/acylaminoacyl peptidase
MLVVALSAIAVLGIRFAPSIFVVHANGENGTRLLRMPSVSATSIAFAYAQNIWVAPKAGGMARRVTSFQGQTSNPHFSPDGHCFARVMDDQTVKISDLANISWRRLARGIAAHRYGVIGRAPAPKHDHDILSARPGYIVGERRVRRPHG